MMRPFVITIFVWLIIVVGISIADCAQDHPRKREPVSFNTDWVTTMLCAAMAFWAGWLLFGSE